MLNGSPMLPIPPAVALCPILRRVACRVVFTDQVLVVHPFSSLSFWHFIRDGPPLLIGPDATGECRRALSRLQPRVEEAGGRCGAGRAEY
jgi:hypothetical protein